MRELFILMSGDESMAKQFRIINDKGDYHILDGDEELCYDLCLAKFKSVVMVYG